MIHSENCLITAVHRTLKELRVVVKLAPKN